MARRRIRVKKIKDIVTLIHQGGTDREISRRTGISRPTVAYYRERLNGSGLNPAEAGSLSSEDLCIRLVPAKKTPERMKAFNDFISENIHEFGRKGVTRYTLWEEYEKNRVDPYRYSQFCNLLKEWRAANKSPVMLMDHAPGEAVFVDYSGLGIDYRLEGESTARKAELLVMVLPASGLVFAIALESQNSLDTLAGCRMGMEYYGGTPTTITPDNMKTAVVKTCRYQPVLNSDFNGFADHYGMVVVPTRAAKPKDKALVENAVQNVQRQIVARVRHCTFTSVGEINLTIGPLLERLNDKPLQKLKISRRQRFESIERKCLRPLPPYPYQARSIQHLKVDSTYHVYVLADHHQYSVPFRYIGKRVRVEIKRNSVEIYAENERIAFHARSRVIGGRTTVAEHRPEAHRAFAEPSRQSMLDRSRGIGPHAMKLVDEIYSTCKSDLGAKRMAAGICSLSGTFGHRVDTACRLAVRNGSLDYRSVKRILDRNEDIAFTRDEERQLNLPEHGNIRGQEAYR
jgi:transposase